MRKVAMFFFLIIISYNLYATDSLKTKSPAGNGFTYSECKMKDDGFGPIMVGLIQNNNDESFQFVSFQILFYNDENTFIDYAEFVVMNLGAKSEKAFTTPFLTKSVVDKSDKYKIKFNYSI